MTKAPPTLTGTSRSVAARAVQTLVSVGVRVVFGIPGVHNQGLYDALSDVPQIKSVVTRHEQGAAFMADGYARSTGEVSLCFLITGPGLTNAATAIAEAYSDAVPMVCLVTCYAEGTSAKGRRLHDLKDQGLVIEGLFKSSSRIESASQIEGVLRDAIATARSGRPGPVAVEVPIEALDAAVTSNPVLSASVDSSKQKVVPGAVPSGPRPVVVIGGGCADGSSSVTSLVEALGAVAFTTAAGKGVLPTHHTHLVGAWLKTETARRLVAQADPLIMLGTEWSTTDLGEAPFDLPDNTLRVDIDDVPHPLAGLDVVGDVTEVVPEWLSRMGCRVERQPWADVSALRESAKGEPRRWPKQALDSVKALNDVLRDDAIVVNDMNTLSYACVELLATARPRRFLFPRGYGTLGYAVPAAIGARFANPGSQVVAICGDGGFLFTAEELATAVRHRLTIPIIIWNNDSFGAIRATRTAAYGRSVDDDLVNPDFVAFAQSFGASGIKVTNAKDLGQAVREASEQPGPTIIEVAAT